MLALSNSPTQLSVYDEMTFGRIYDSVVWSGGGLHPLTTDPDSIPDSLLDPQDVAEYRACRLHRSRTDPADRDPACEFGLDGRKIEGSADA